MKDKTGCTKILPNKTISVHYFENICTLSLIAFQISQSLVISRGTSNRHQYWNNISTVHLEVITKLQLC